MNIKFLLLTVAAIFVFSWIRFDRIEDSIAGGDPLGYYVHLPSTFLYHDIGDYKTTMAAWRKHYPRQIDFSIGQPTPTGRLAVKYPVGVALLQSPFFAVAHLYCLLSGQASADGFSYPYRFLICLSALLYSLIGLLLVWKTLGYFAFSNAVRLGTVSVLALGTNLFYFATYNTGMAHAYLFFLFAALLYATVRFYQAPALARAAGVGAAAGAIALTRLPDAIFVLVPLLWGLEKGHFARLWQWRRYLLAATAAFFIFLIPQALYYKMVSGQWWYDGYIGESFNFARPHLREGLLSAKNGWLLYTPLMCFALCGLFLLGRYAKAARWPLFLLLPIHVYITYSWWCWNYINGLGSRPMVDIYPLLALPLAAFGQYCLQRRWSTAAAGLGAAFFIWLNLFQSWQLSKGILWSENGNFAHYRAIWGDTRESKTGVVAYQSSEYQPDMRQWQCLDTLGIARMEDSTDANYTAQYRFSGKYAYRCKGEYSPGVVVETDTCSFKSGDCLRVSVRAFLPPGASTNGNEAALLTVELNIKDGEKVKVRSIKPATLTSANYSIWAGGETNRWAEADFFVRIPPTVFKNGLIKVYVWNPTRQDISIDERVVEQGRKRD